MLKCRSISIRTLFPGPGIGSLRNHARIRTLARAHDELAMRDVSVRMFVGYRNVEVCKNCSRYQSVFVIFALSPLVASSFVPHLPQLPVCRDMESFSARRRM